MSATSRRERGITTSSISSALLPRKPRPTEVSISFRPLDSAKLQVRELRKKKRAEKKREGTEEGRGEGLHAKRERGEGNGAPPGNSDVRRKHSVRSM